MSCFSLSKGTCQKITSMMWKFLWSGSLDKRSMHWLPWDRMSMPKGQGEWPRDTSTGVSSPAIKKMIPIDHQRSGRFLFPRSHWSRGPWRRRVRPNRRNCLSTSSTYRRKKRVHCCLTLLCLNCLKGSLPLSESLHTFMSFGCFTFT